MSKAFSYVSLFSGAGGLDIGLERSGLRAVSLCEIERLFCDTLAENRDFTHCDGFNYFQSAKILNTDVRELSGRDLAGNRAGCVPEVGENLLTSSGNSFIMLLPTQPGQVG